MTNRLDLYMVLLNHNTAKLSQNFSEIIFKPRYFFKFSKMLDTKCINKTVLVCRRVIINLQIGVLFISLAEMKTRWIEI